MASAAYSEHVGEKRQAAGNHGETIILYARIAFNAMPLTRTPFTFVLREAQRVDGAILQNRTPSSTALGDSQRNQIPVV